MKGLCLHFRKLLKQVHIFVIHPENSPPMGTDQEVLLLLLGVFVANFGNWLQTSEFFLQITACIRPSLNANVVGCRAIGKSLCPSLAIVSAAKKFLLAGREGKVKLANQVLLARKRCCCPEIGLERRRCQAKTVQGGAIDGGKGRHDAPKCRGMGISNVQMAIGRGHEGRHPHAHSSLIFRKDTECVEMVKIQSLNYEQLEVYHHLHLPDNNFSLCAQPTSQISHHSHTE